MRLGLITLVAAGLMLLAGFAAAAVASGGNPLELLRDKPAKTAIHQPRGKLAAPPGHAKSSPLRPSRASGGEDADEAGDEDDDSNGGPTPQPRVEHKVTLCHHTGSWKHPFHAISVDEHALTAHSAHGDTVGACPATPTPVKPHQNRPKPGNRGRNPGKQKGAGHDNGRRPSKAGVSRSHSR